MTGDAGIGYSPQWSLRLLFATAQHIGTIGPGDLDAHLTHASAFVDAVLSVDASADRRPLRVLDLGTGGGIPGLVIAERVRNWSVTLLDGRTERIRLLDEQLDELDSLTNVTTVARRAELAAHEPALRFSFDIVVARSFAAPAVTAECAAGFLAVGGLLVVSEPPDAGRRRWPDDGCAQLGLAVLDVPALRWSFALLRSETPCSERYPRRVGIPGKRPLFGENRP